MCEEIELQIGEMGWHKDGENDLRRKKAAFFVRTKPVTSFQAENIAIIYDA